MTKRTPLQQWKLDRLEERMGLRELAQEVECTYCGAEVGKPCVYPSGSFKGEPLGRMDHECRLTAAANARDEQEAEEAGR